MYIEADTDVCRLSAAGGKILMQLVHGSSYKQGDPERARILGPSALRHPESGLVPKEMTRREIDQVAECFAQAALRAKAAGFDGVQIHCAHGYLLAQFLSPLFNHRGDEYGGSPENRVRMARQVYAAVRQAVGAEYPVWVKMNSSDELPGGLTTEEFLQMAALLSADGVDAIEVSGDRWKSHRADERAYYRDAAMRLSEQVETPVILTGGLRQRSDLEAVCANSRVNFFGFARPFLRDPNFLRILEM